MSLKAKPIPATPKDLGHKPEQVGFWVICAVCKMTKRKRGWWKPCPGQVRAPQSVYYG